MKFLCALLTCSSLGASLASADDRLCVPCAPQPTCYSGGGWNPYGSSYGRMLSYTEALARAEAANRAEAALADAQRQIAELQGALDTAIAERDAALQESEASARLAADEKARANKADSLRAKAEDDAEQARKARQKAANARKQAEKERDAALAAAAQAEDEAAAARKAQQESEAALAATQSERDEATAALDDARSRIAELEASLTKSTDESNSPAPVPQKLNQPEEAAKDDQPIDVQTTEDDVDAE